MPRVAVATPLHMRAHLTPDEEVSLRHLIHFLGRYDRYLISPRSLDFHIPGFRVKRFGDRFFGSADANKALLLSRRFYESFLDYEYVLIYHLDALVFSDQLEQWCERGLDYIGAPWLVSGEEPELGFSRVGNGGLSLRRVRSFLRVMESTRYRHDPEERWRRYHAWKPWPRRVLNLHKRYLNRVRGINGVRRELKHYRPNEDHFWADRAPHYDPFFKVATVEDGLRFAFECAPRYCFQQSGGRMPFGCHAWPVYDRAFWEPYLLDPRTVGAPAAAR
jgi:hypothetical protein